MARGGEARAAMVAGADLRLARIASKSLRGGSAKVAAFHTGWTLMRSASLGTCPVMFGAKSSISPSHAAPPRVVIVGAGFGGLWAAKTLANAPVEVVVIDRENYHLFQPLLYQVATAGLSPADIAAPIRGIVGAHRNVTVLLGEIVGVDVVARTVSIMGGRHVPYDYLVLATGARHAYFGHDEWELLAPGLKRIEDATEISTADPDRLRASRERGGRG